jgi:site-specific DNA recombinase
MLAGLLRCAACDAAMTPTWSEKKGRRYRYYLCTRAHRQGWNSCPSKSVSANQIEAFVVDQVRAVGRDPDLVARTVEEARKQLASSKSDLEVEEQQVHWDLEKAQRDLRRHAKAVSANGRPRRRTVLPDPQETIRTLQDRLAAIQQERAALKGRTIDVTDLRAALHAFDPVWDQLTTLERARVMQLLIETIDYDGGTGSLGITFRPGGVRTLATETTATAEARP